MKTINIFNSMVDEKILEQTEQMVQNVNFDENEELDEMNPEDSIFDVSDEDINASLNALDNSSANDPSTAYIKKVRAKSKTKKSISEIADEVVNAYLADKSDANWKNLQEFFWYGIRQFSLKYVKNMDDAYDMTIETFINAHEKIDLYDPTKGKFSTWLWIICRNICLGFIRTRAKENIIDNDIADIYDSAMFSSAYGSSIDDINYNVDGTNIVKVDADESIKELYNVSLNEMKNIGGLTQQILEMKLVKDMKIREIADTLNMHESTVKNYLYKGKTNLAKILQVNHKQLYESYIDSNAYRDEQSYM